MDESFRDADSTSLHAEGGRTVMTRVRLPLQMAILAIVLATAGRADAAAVSDRDLQAKMAYCKTCHGVSGRGFRGGYYPIPRLAGQPVKYIENQVQAFVEHRRTNNVMFNVAHVLSPEMVAAIAKSFHDLNPEPLGGAPRGLAPEGKKLFDAGIPPDVPPCAMCHGPEGKGNDDFPRLAGQLYDYIFAKLKNWDKERGQNPKDPDTSAIMQPIAHGLSDAQIKAVASYVSELK
jgi:cytochrome c553